MEESLKVYTKNDLVEEVYTLNEGVITKTVAKQSIQNLFDLLDSELSNFNAISLKKIDTLVPRKRSGGRPVRNPKTGETKSMYDDVTVKLKGKSTMPIENGSKVPHSLLLEKLSELCYSTKVAEDTLNTFLEALHDISNGAGKMEIRNFGVFYSRWHEDRNSRNPSTGEKLVAQAGWSLGFKCSKVIKRKLTALYV